MAVLLTIRVTIIVSTIHAWKNACKVLLRLYAQQQSWRRYRWSTACWRIHW